MKKTRSNQMFKVVLIACGLLFVVYLGMSLYFTKHFYFGTKINGISASAKTIEKVDEEISSHTKNYILTLEERNEKSETISADDIDLKYVRSGKVEELKKQQSGFAWILAPFTKKDNKFEVKVDYDNEKLQNKISKLECLDETKILEPKNASIEYKNNNFIIVDEVYGNRINEDKLREYIEESIKSGEFNLNLEEKDLYKNPEYTSESEEVKSAIETLNTYGNTSVTYELGNKTEVLKSGLIKTWLSVDEKFNVIINNDEVWGYINSLASKYNTYGSTRNFRASTGADIKIYGGDYGWVINKSKEVEDLIAKIKEGQVINKEPIYSQRAAIHNDIDYGNTYVEINLATQHLWLYKDGQLIVESDLVSGNVSAGWETPVGIYGLTYKEKDTFLTGEDYRTPVEYWMPFNGNIGMHDLYRRVYGGTEYLTNGSHGCINLPLNIASIIFENVQVGMPVIVYQ